MLVSVVVIFTLHTLFYSRPISVMFIIFLIIIYICCNTSSIDTCFIKDNLTCIDLVCRSILSSEQFRSSVFCCFGRVRQPGICYQTVLVTQHKSQHV